jgi:hypothetical protein
MPRRIEWPDGGRCREVVQQRDTRLLHRRPAESSAGEGGVTGFEHLDEPCGVVVPGRVSCNKADVRHGLAALNHVGFRARRAPYVVHGGVDVARGVAGDEDDGRHYQ